MKRIIILIVILNIFGCSNSDIQELQPSKSSFHPADSSLWIAKNDIYGLNRRTLFYFHSDSLFIELNEVKINQSEDEFFEYILSNNLTVQTFFIKSKNNFLMGRDTWSHDVDIKYNKINFEEITLKIDSKGEMMYEHELRKVNPTDSISFEFKEYYSNQLNEFISDTLVYYGLNNNNKVIMNYTFQGRNISEFILTPFIEHNFNINKNQIIFKNFETEELYILEQEYTLDPKKSCGAKLNQVRYTSSKV
jgi:hypothetical protein